MIAYGDLGKNARKILSEAYNGHLIEIGVSHGLPGNVTLNTSTRIDTLGMEKSMDVDLATKLQSKDKTVAVVDKRGLTDRSHSLTATISNFLDVNNLALVADSKGKLTFNYKNDHVNTSVECHHDTDIMKPTVCCSQDGKAVGIKTNISFAPEESRSPYKTCVAAGINNKEFGVHVHADDDLNKVGGSLYHRMGPIEGALVASKWLQEGGAFNVEVGARYNLPDKFFVGAKIDNNLKVGLCCKKILDNVMPYGLELSASLQSYADNLNDLQIGGGIEFSHNFEFMSGATTTTTGGKGGGGKQKLMDDGGGEVRLMDYVDVTQLQRILKDEQQPEQQQFEQQQQPSLNRNHNSTYRPSRRLSLTAQKYSKQRAGATSKELGDNCTDEKCKVRKRFWEEGGSIEEEGTY